MRIALDTNVLVYAEGVMDDSRSREAIEIIQSIPSARIVIPVQVLGELFNVLVRKSGIPLIRVRATVLEWCESHPTANTSFNTLQVALDLASEHQLAIWDAIILATAAEAGCQVLLSEDMHHGFSWRGVTVVNPFASPPHPLLAELTEG